MDRLALLDWIALLDRLALALNSCQREPGLLDGGVGLAPHARTSLAVLPRRAFLIAGLVRTVPVLTGARKGEQ